MKLQKTKKANEDAGRPSLARGWASLVINLTLAAVIRDSLAHHSLRCAAYHCTDPGFRPPTSMLNLLVSPCAIYKLV